MRRVFFAATALALAAAAACGDDGVYVYTARKYDPAAGCLEPYAPVDTITGEKVSSKCLPYCFALDGVTYVTDVCPPLPANATAVAGSDPTCIAAYEQLDASCGAAAVLDASDDGG